MKEFEPSLTFLRMTSPNADRVGDGTLDSLLTDTRVVSCSVGMPSTSSLTFRPGPLVQYVSSTYCMMAIGMLLIMRVRRATRMVNTGSEGGGRREQDSPSHSHRVLRDCTVDGSLRQLACRGREEEANIGVRRRRIGSQLPNKM